MLQKNGFVFSWSEQEIEVPASNASKIRWLANGTPFEVTALATYTELHSTRCYHVCCQLYAVEEAFKSGVLGYLQLSPFKECRMNALRVALVAVAASALIGVLLRAQSRASAVPPSVSAVGRFQIVAAPATSIPGNVFLIDSASGRVWQYLVDPACKNGSAGPGSASSSGQPSTTNAVRLQCFSEIDRIQ